MGTSSSEKKILGESHQVHELIKLIKKVAPAKTNILVIGESGTGKELVARMIHDTSPMKGRPFVPVNCGAIPENLIESELFGHKKGSFTGAVSDKPGLFEVADGGTLFLDEVGELPLGMQVKVLRAIQERSFRRVGGNEDIKVDVRLIAATNRDLEQAVQKGTFREDLYYRLNVILIMTPPLRERKGDVSLLAKAFLKKSLDKLKAAKQNRDLDGFEKGVLEVLEAYHWPGNIRELENIIERAVTLETKNRITIDSLPGVISSLRKDILTEVKPESLSSRSSIQDEIKLPAPIFDHGPLSLDAILQEAESKYLQAAIDHVGGIKKQAAELLGITFRSFRYRAKKLTASSTKKKPTRKAKK